MRAIYDITSGPQKYNSNVKVKFLTQVCDLLVCVTKVPAFGLAKSKLPDH